MHMGAPKNPRLLLNHHGDDIVLPLVLKETLIGRIDSNHVVLEAEDVSRIHARVLVGPSGVEVEDCGSTQGTLVNGDPIDRVFLKDGDVVQVGSVKILFAE
ncbi:MAG: FHA domain-containing protein [Deltaproteobacteria bacterium]|nr:FHA domain-containing protein [Deltaproteobacteria bacterium]